VFPRLDGKNNGNYLGVYKVVYFINNKVVMFPIEIIDLIILLSDFKTSITLVNDYTSKKLYNSKVNTWDNEAQNGNLDIIKWLDKHNKQGCTNWAMDLAAKHGHFEIVKWLHFNRNEGCTDFALTWASMWKHFDIVMWLVCNRPELDKTGALQMASRLKYGNAEIYRYLTTLR
jgi:hypothetical protein